MSLVKLETTEEFKDLVRILAPVGRPDYARDTIDRGTRYVRGLTVEQLEALENEAKRAIRDMAAQTKLMDHVINSIDAMSVRNPDAGGDR